MRSPILNFLFGVFTAFVVLGALYLIFSPSFESRATVNLISNVASPDGEFIATTNRASNRNGWCEQRTNVHRKNEGFDWETEFVFIINCGSEVEPKWKDNKNLVITYSYNDAGIAKTSQEFTSKNKDVNISYVLKQ